MSIINFAGINEEEVAKLYAALDDTAFVAEMAAQSDAAGVQKVLAAKGINFTVEEVEKIREAIAKAAAGEISEEDLESVAGGIVWIGSVTYKINDKWSITVNIPW